MFTKKTSLIWGVNLILFVSVVFLGIQQASRGADISNLEDKLSGAVIQKQELSEEIFRNGSEVKLSENAQSLGFLKPLKIYYFNSIGTVASRR